MFPEHENGGHRAAIFLLCRSGGAGFTPFVGKGPQEFIHALWPIGIVCNSFRIIQGHCCRAIGNITLAVRLRRRHAVEIGPAHALEIEQLAGAINLAIGAGRQRVFDQRIMRFVQFRLCFG